MEDICKVPVKFSEIDSMHRVWHGNYVTYFEDGRESFNRHYPGISYQTMMDTQTYAAVYEVHVRYLAPLSMNDVAEVHTEYVPHPGARLDFKYRIYRESDHVLCADGHTTQLFIDQNGELLLESPQFYLDWREKYGV